jgi:hypothetical protein
VNEPRETIVMVRGRVDFTLKAHSGPIDQRALTSTHPDIVMDSIKILLRNLNLDFQTTTDPFKLVVEQLEIPELTRQHSKSSNQSISSRRNSNSGITSFFQKLKYISMFGFQYNRGFDGNSTIPNVFIKTNHSYVKFYIMVHRIKNLKGLYIVDLKRMKGDIWEFKRLYHDIINQLQLSPRLK